MNSSSIPWKVLSSKIAVNVLSEGWGLSTPDEGEPQTRHFTVDIFFDSPFASPPVVQIGLTGFDIDQRDSARLSVSADQITEYGFQATISTWANTRVYAVELNWFALGA